MAPSSAGRARLLGEMVGISSEQGMAEKSAGSGRRKERAQDEPASKNTLSFKLPASNYPPRPLLLDEPTVWLRGEVKFKLWD